MPVTIGIFINPGFFPSAQKGGRARSNRSFEYDTLSDQYARFLLEEILPEFVTESAFSYESIREVVQKLPEKQADILQLMHEEGYTAREVAEKLGMNESAVKVAAHRAYKILRKKLEQ